MVIELEKMLEKRWGEYVRLRDSGEAYSAAIRLAEIENCLEHQRFRESERQKWEFRVREAESIQALGAILDGAERATGRLQQLLNTGTNYVYEELILVVTIRVELAVLLDSLAQRCSIDALIATISNLDNDLLEIAKSKRHRTLFASAREAARRNWGIPLVSKWLVDSVAN